MPPQGDRHVGSSISRMLGLSPWLRCSPDFSVVRTLPPQVTAKQHVGVRLWGWVGLQSFLQIFPLMVLVFTDGLYLSLIVACCDLVHLLASLLP